MLQGYGNIGQRVQGFNLQGLLQLNYSDSSVAYIAGCYTMLVEKK